MNDTKTMDSALVPPPAHRQRNIGKALLVCSMLALAAGHFYGPDWLQSFLVAIVWPLWLWGGILTFTADVSFLSRREIVEWEERRIAEWEERRSERAARLATD